MRMLLAMMHRMGRRASLAYSLTCSACDCEADSNVPLADAFQDTAADALIDSGPWPHPPRSICRNSRRANRRGPGAELRENLSGMLAHFARNPPLGPQSLLLRKLLVRLRLRQQTLWNFHFACSRCSKRSRRRSRRWFEGVGHSYWPSPDPAACLRPALA